MATNPNFNQMLAMRVFVRVVEAGTFTNAATVSYTHLTLPTILRV